VVENQKSEGSGGHSRYRWDLLIQIAINTFAPLYWLFVATNVVEDIGANKWQWRMTFDA
jgi:hypothetical protein